MCDGPPEPKETPQDVSASGGAGEKNSACLQSVAKLGVFFGGVNRGSPEAPPRKGAPRTMGGGAGGSDGPFSPWYSPHTGTLRQKLVEINDKRNGTFRVKIYPAGVILEKSLGFAMERSEGANRGQIEGFSDEAARRLKEAFMSLQVPGFELWAFTLTTHKVFTAEEWRALMARFRVAVKRAGWSGIWRVELQRRQTPHDHVAFWLPPGVGHDEVTALWLNATGETNDSEAQKHAVVSKRIPQDETGWAVYMGCHNGKKKEAQLGWLGKQWGIWNEKLFVEREPDRCELDAREHPVFLRVLRHLDVSQRRLHNRQRDEKQLREWGSPPSVVIVAEKVRPRRLHQGNLLRCVRGETVSAIVGAIKSDRIYPAQRDVSDRRSHSSCEPVGT